MKKGPTPKRAWQPMVRGVAFRTPEREAKLAAVIGEEAAADRDVEVWLNDQYVATVDRDEGGVIAVISIRRQDRKHPRDWRDFQRIKNEIAGPEIEAVELYPAESRLMDTANQYWLWCLAPGERAPFGFNDGRIVFGSDIASEMGAGQRDLP